MHRCCFISSITLETRAELPGRVASLARDEDAEQDTRNAVAAILAEVRRDGLAAALRCTETFDGLKLAEAEIRVPRSAMDAALARLRADDPGLVAALETLAANVRRFAEGQRHALQDLELPMPDGGTVGERWVPLECVGVYVPGGRAFYPSTLAMTVIPAQVAGVKRIVAVTPPKTEGVDPLVLACAGLLGVEELVTLGGAQAVAWLAYGEPAVLVSADAGLLAAVEAELAARVVASPRRAILEQSLSRHGRLIRAERDLALGFAQLWAPEHLELVVRDPEAWVPELTTAGALFIGASSAEAFGDYGAGPNHVLPTSRTARYASPLGVATFLKRQSLLRLTPADAAAMAPWVTRLAQAEGLPHHGASAALRGGKRP